MANEAAGQCLGALAAGLVQRVLLLVVYREDGQRLLHRGAGVGPRKNPQQIAERPL